VAWRSTPVPGIEQCRSKLVRHPRLKPASNQTAIALSHAHLPPFRMAMALAEAIRTWPLAWDLAQGLQSGAAR
jgi:hypothetical protein